MSEDFDESLLKIELYSSTDLVDKNAWLLSTPLLDMLGNQFSGDLISLYGYHIEKHLYVGESMNQLIQHGPDPATVLYTWTEAELAEQFEAKWWSTVSGIQISRIHSKITQAKSICFELAAIEARNTVLSKMTPENYSWQRYPAEDITFLTDGSLSYKDSIGYYTQNHGKWLTWTLQNEEEASRFNLEETSSETECRAKIINKLMELDPDENLYKFA